MFARFIPVLKAAISILLLSGCEPTNLGGTAGVVVNGPPGPPALSVPPPAAEAPPSPIELTGPDVIAGSGAPADDSAPTATPLPETSEPLSAPASPPPPADGASAQFINLSAGVALPQLLPEGTQVGISVDYALRGNPNTSCRYLLVVESSAGETAMPVKVEPQGGTFQGFLPPAVRPEHQPFRARIDEVSPRGERVRASNSAVLATSY